MKIDIVQKSNRNHGSEASGTGNSVISPKQSSDGQDALGAVVESGIKI